MQDKAMIIMEPTEYGSDEHACLYIERSALGMVSLLNMFNMSKGKEYKLLLLDDDGGVITETISENYKLFKLPKNFSISGVMYAELYWNQKLVLSGKYGSGKSEIDYKEEYDKRLGISCEREPFEISDADSEFEGGGISAKEWAEETGQLDLYSKATEILDKFKKGEFDNMLCLPKENNYEEITNIDDFNEIDRLNELAKDSAVKVSKEWEYYADPNLEISYWEAIEEDFEELFLSGKRESSLERIFKNSLWARHLHFGETVCFGKIYKESCYVLGAMPDIVAVAVPVIAGKIGQTQLGKYAEFVKTSRCNDFGFMVLLQDAKSGRPIKIIKNKG